MKITYIKNSGVLIELNTCCLLIDYYEGDIPSINKPLYVLVSHAHHDHYNEAIFTMFNSNTNYILSNDIDYTNNNLNIIKVGPLSTYKINNILTIKTLKSTDEGIAFIIEIEDKIIYHAGDLNLWLWNDESNEYNLKMEKMYLKQITKLNNYVFDLAFVPIDPRQEELMYLGLNSFLNNTMAKHIFPIHFGEKFYVTKYANKYITNNIIILESLNQIIKI